ncbi:uncharacterized protein Bfra_004997 [Botrytis fragariae]|uniref:Uncharacterized protein n=1 Tax=Botrytis fragariae TaxID=1964551 RepID=A0A8H6AU54_9HELO|nr:uncharacterized protein Bfra_004997 [Botrytis fragariae]KAF5873535.1 hypothetical protein Bfra_004997 [Botrytis fragariae]
MYHYAHLRSSNGFAAIKNALIASFHGILIPELLEKIIQAISTSVEKLTEVVLSSTATASNYH